MATGYRIIPLTLAVAVAMAGCDDKAAKQAAGAPPPVEVSVVTVTPQRVSLATELPGRVSALRMSEVRPQVSGIILKRMFQEGSEVKAGQQLYQIDPASYQAAVDSAKAALDKAQANYKSVQAKADRYRDLVKINAVSRQDYDDIVASLEQNRADVAAAKAALDAARINLDYTRVFAPISGRIGKSSFTEGALVTANQTTPMATVQQLDPVYVDINQSSSQLIQLRRAFANGELQKDSDGNAAVTLTMEGDSKPYNGQGRLQFSDVSVDESTGAVQLRALFPNPDHELLPGLFVRAVVQQGVKDQAIALPQQAVSRSPDGNALVWVVDGESKVAPRPVKTERAIGDKWLISEGLKAGEQVVVEGVLKIRPGATVKAVPAAGAPAAAAAAGAAPATK